MGRHQEVSEGSDRKVLLQGTLKPFHEETQADPLQKAHQSLSPALQNPSSQMPATRLEKVSLSAGATHAELSGLYGATQLLKWPGGASQAPHKDQQHLLRVQGEKGQQFGGDPQCAEEQVMVEQSREGQALGEN